MPAFLSRAPVFVVGILVFTSMYFLFFMTKSSSKTGENAQYATCGVSNGISKANKGKDKIGVGVEADYVEFPWQAYIEIQMKSGTSYTCGGSLISDQWILTAAQCLKTNTEGDQIVEVWVTLGMHNYKTANDLNRRTFELDMNSFFFHPDYSETLDADIALIKLPTIVTFSRFVRPVCLADWKEMDYVGEQVTIAGWGSTFHDQWEYFPNDAVLYKMRATVMSKSYCSDSFGEIEDSVLCTKGNGLGRSGACIISNYDLGSPVIFKRSNGKWRQIGILSLAKDCNKNPSILYTRVSFYAPWIKHTMARSSGSHSFPFLSPTLISINLIIIYLKM